MLDRIKEKYKEERKNPPFPEDTANLMWFTVLMAFLLLGWPAPYIALKVSLFAWVFLFLFFLLCLIPERAGLFRWIVFTWRYLIFPYLPIVVGYAFRLSHFGLTHLRMWVH